MKMRHVVIIVLLVTAGCASAPKTLDPQNSLRHSAELYWKLRMADRYEETYKMEKSEGLPPYSEYLNKVKGMKRLNIDSCTVRDVQVEDGKGTVEVEVALRLPEVRKPVSQTIKDRWIYREGEWLHELPRQ